MTVLALLAAVWAAQDPAGWTVRPATPTVGDTIWLERRITVPPDWTVRPGRLPRGGAVEALSDAVVRGAPGGWVVAYPVVAWATGPHTVELPLLWQLGPMGEADSAPGGIATFAVASVLPDTGAPAPRPPRGVLRRETRRPAWLVGAGAVAAGLLAAGWRWRRRAPRREAAAPHPPVEGEVRDGSWLALGEPRAVAARAAAHLRAAVARAVPEAHTGLTTDECLAVLARARPEAGLAELMQVLRDLDHAAFAAVPAADVAALASRARALAAGGPEAR